MELFKHMKRLLLLVLISSGALPIYSGVAVAESPLVLRDCENNIRRTISSPAKDFIVSVNLEKPSSDKVIARSTTGEVFEAVPDNLVASFTELNAGDWTFCSQPIKSITYSSNDRSNDNGSLLLASLTGAGALAGVVSFGGSNSGGSSATENLSLDKTSPAPVGPTSSSATGGSSADFAIQCLNEEEIDVMSRMN